MSPLNEPTSKLPRNYGVPDAWQQDRAELQRLRAELERLRLQLTQANEDVAVTGQAYEDARDELERLQEENERLLALVADEENAAADRAALEGSE